MTELDNVEPSVDKDPQSPTPAKAKTPWYQKQTRFNHDCKPHRPPNGSRRSLGKR